MAKVKNRCRSRHHHDKGSPYSLHMEEDRDCKKALEKKDWQNATCSVCLEYPHNAVLLLCSSHNEGCRPYMCATSYRYSNCLEQYKKAYTKQDNDNDNNEVWELLCPLCRGEVKGWTVVEAARKHLNCKKRSCMQEKCSFVGSYKALRKHVRADHPRARPREVDPSLAEKWKKLENDRDVNDVMSTISATMPGSIIMGDYVIEGNFPDYFGGLVFRLDGDDASRRVPTYVSGNPRRRHARLFLGRRRRVRTAES